MDIRSFISGHPRSRRAAIIAEMAKWLKCSPPAIRHYANGTRTPSPQVVAMLERKYPVIRCEHCLPDVQWIRGADGNVIAYQTPIYPAPARKVA
jgi:hypothetical protein